jgi:hypothetical protein
MFDFHVDSVCASSGIFSVYLITVKQGLYHVLKSILLAYYSILSTCQFPNAMGMKCFHIGIRVRGREAISQLVYLFVSSHDPVAVAVAVAICCVLCCAVIAAKIQLFGVCHALSDSRPCVV